MHRIFLTISLGLSLIVAGVGTGFSAAGQDITWKAVLVAGDNVQNVFDTAVRDMAKQLQEDYGIEPAHIQVLSAMATDEDRQATGSALVNAFKRLDINQSDGCFVFVTSHGDVNGLVLRNANRYLTPKNLTSVMSKFCPDQPSVLVLSGCHSGTFLTSGDLAAPNRIILTAAHVDRVSFGCSNDETYTFYDGCFLESLRPGLVWQEVAQKIQECVSEKEEKLKAEPSLPQTYIGEEVKDMVVFKH